MPTCFLNCTGTSLFFYYLNDVEEGGETAFPVADMKTFNETVSAACHDSLLTSTDVQILAL